MSIRDTDLAYIPQITNIDHQFGVSIFDGVPSPTKAAFELLGEREVKNVQEIFSRMIQHRITMFGDDLKRYGLPASHFFYHVPSETSVAVMDPFRYFRNIFHSPLPPVRLGNLSPEESASPEIRAEVLKSNLSSFSDKLQFPEHAELDNFYLIEIMEQLKHRKRRIQKLLENTRSL